MTGILEAVAVIGIVGGAVIALVRLAGWAECAWWWLREQRNRNWQR